MMVMEWCQHGPLKTRTPKSLFIHFVLSLVKEED